MRRPIPRRVQTYGVMSVSIMLEGSPECGGGWRLAPDRGRRGCARTAVGPCPLPGGRPGGERTHRREEGQVRACAGRRGPPGRRFQHVGPCASDQTTGHWRAINPGVEGSVTVTSGASTVQLRAVRGPDLSDSQADSTVTLPFMRSIVALWPYQSPESLSG
jgi:hypothetical protein